MSVDVTQYHDVILERCRDAELEIKSLRSAAAITERRASEPISQLEVALAEKDQTIDQLRRQADVQGRQLVRLRVADRRRIKGIPARDIPARQLDAIVPSSLAFHEEMVSFLEALPVSGMRIVRCYPYSVRGVRL